ncbi:hypothetical protein DPMN_011465 [Dreissena polymorpha]|uniref:Uncharacterized protein n=1 Tax=Dreissena polymorpha TaxID=45954 RepID=A0A9D4N0L9_DREPO|nr:hypothetical protein DPMN_011465 [Dreissena polymorpha]
MLISHYQEWFEESMIYWLQTFRSECIQRMEKALEIDKDVNGLDFCIIQLYSDELYKMVSKPNVMSMIVLQFLSL